MSPCLSPKQMAGVPFPIGNFSRPRPQESPNSIVISASPAMARTIKPMIADSLILLGAMRLNANRMTNSVDTKGLARQLQQDFGFVRRGLPVRNMGRKNPTLFGLRPGLQSVFILPAARRGFGAFCTLSSGENLIRGGSARRVTKSSESQPLT